MIEPHWLPIARKYIGLTEIPGKAHNPTIIRWLTELKAWWKEDETPWCGTFVAAVLREAGLVVPKHWYRAKAYLDYGVAPPNPFLGSIVVFERKGGGHVGFVVGVDERDRIMVLGGNQANAVNVQPFDRSRVAGFRWPFLEGNIPVANPRMALPLIKSGGRAASRDEA
jgi:uncharacterized protein (TIGR02594 family)